MRINKTHIPQLITILLCSLIPFTTSSETTIDVDPRVTQSRGAVMLFADALIAELKYSLEEGGSARAIRVCHIEAPQIAKDISEQRNWQISRTSLKTRNPKNNPDEWETKVLQQFEQRKQQGEDISTLEFFEVIHEYEVQEAQVSGDAYMDIGGSETQEAKAEDRKSDQTSEETEDGFRYMKAIPTKGLCLTCHGEALTEPVKATLAELYPEDKATGFKVGDIRGAFSIIQK